MMQLDKIAYTLAGAAIAAALLPLGVIPALLAIVAAAVGKELWDAQGHGTPQAARPTHQNPQMVK